VTKYFGRQFTFLQIFNLLTLYSLGFLHFGVALHIMKWVLLITCTLIFSTCSNPKDDNVRLRLTSNERRQIDTLVSREVRTMRPYYDSLCQINFETMVAAATDSIVQKRLEEELRLRARIPLPNANGQ